MPIYEYQCENCQAEFEMLLPTSGDNHVTCPKCGAKSIKRLLSSPCIGGTSLSGCSSGASRRGFS